jgi:hypothetical protein
MRLNDTRPPACISSWTAYDPAYPDRPLWSQCLTLAHTEQLPCCLCDASVDDPQDLTRVVAVRPRAHALYLARGGLARVIIPRRYRSKKAKNGPQKAGSL